MKTTKGQAAMEFLMTYGWAILAAIIVIGILGYYYFSRDVLTPKAAVVNPPFYLNGQVVNTSGVSLELKNNGDDTYNVTKVTVTNCGESWNGVNLVVGSVASGSTVLARVNCTLTPANTFKGTITVYYTKSGSTLEQTTTGSITQSVS